MTSSRVVRLLTALVAGAVAVVVLAPAVALLLPAAGLSAAAVPAALATVLLLCLLPALELLFPGPEERTRLAVAAVPATALGVAAACAVAGLAVDRFDAAHPVPSRLAYVLDRDTGQASWVSTEQTLGAWTEGHVGSRFELPSAWPHLGGEVWSGRAEAADLAAAEVTTVSDALLGGRRELTVRVTPRRPGVRMLVLDLRVDGGTVLAGRVAGRDVPQEELGGDRVWIEFHAPPEGGLQASFGIEGGGAVDLRVVDGSDGLDGLPGHQPRPEGVDAAGSLGADVVLVAGTTDLG
jgi:hypothetical protein